jgi:amidohydrolase
MINKLKELIEGIKGELIELSEFILHNPELGLEEKKSSQAHIDLLKKHGFKVKEGYLGMETAFRAEYESEKDGPTIAYLAEYDALPVIGHGCGHNILGTTSTGAGIILSKFIDEIGGRAVVFGTPAEETVGGKVEIANKGGFNDIDIAMIVHPADKHYKSGSSLAMKAIEFTYKGKSAHAAASPEEGINALDAAINTFNNINALREHIRRDARVHGIITEGGKAPNVVPELAVARFYVRATTKEYLEELEKKIINCAKGASLAAGTEIEYKYFENPFYNLITNQKLSDTYSSNLKKMGVEKIYDSQDSFGSLDAGNVSQICPTIHPYFSISTKKLIAHTREFRDETSKPYAYQEMVKTIGALALTGIDIIKDGDLLKEIKSEFESI